jgi:hypothetical protein
MQRSMDMGHRLRSLCAAAVLAVLLVPAAAGADVLSLYGAIQGGGAGGKGVGGEAQAEAFHPGVQGLAYGALVGVEVLFLDGWVEHTQHLQGGSLAGTWTQFMVGLDTQIDIGEPRYAPSEHLPPEQAMHVKPEQGSAPGYFDIGFAVGFGVGTGQQVMPPLDNSEVTDKGFLGQVHLGLGYRLSRNVSAGVRVPVQGAYLFKSGDGAAANDRGNQYTSVHGALLLELRLSLPVR